MHYPEHFDMSAFKELRFVLEFSKPLIDRTGAVPKARVDVRYFFKSPVPPPGWDGSLESVNWTEEMMASHSEIAGLQEWASSIEMLSTSGPRQNLIRWMTTVGDALADALGKEAPNIGDPDDDEIISTLNAMDSLRGFDDAMGELLAEYERFLDSPSRVPDAIEREERTVEEQLAALEELSEDEAEVADDPGGLGGSSSKKARDFPPTPEYEFEAAAPPGETSGVLCDNIKEEVPQYIKANCERIIRKEQFPGNAWIVLGRDRPASRASGYGGAGATHASSIDLVVGRMASQARSTDNTGGPVKVDPDFKNDAARIYISQMTDIDNYFGLADGGIGNFTTKSGIGLKADGIRLVAREGIKFVTGTDASNAQGSQISGKYGIDLIANNDDRDMQPIPLGGNLAEALKELAVFVDELAGIVDGLLDAQMIFNKELTSHTHRSPFYALDTTPSIPCIPVGTKTTMEHTLKTKKDLYMFKINIGNYKMDYLDASGAAYINSRYNKVN